MNNQQKTEITFLHRQGYEYNKIAASLGDVTTDRFFTPTQFQQDVDYYRAQCIAKAMLDSGLISLSQFNKLTELNQKAFSPFLHEIMPKTT